MEVKACKDCQEMGTNNVIQGTPVEQQASTSSDLPSLKKQQSIGVSGRADVKEYVTLVCKDGKELEAHKIIFPKFTEDKQASTFIDFRGT